MNSARWEQIKEIFGEAVELPTSQQTAFVARACGTDRALLSEVQRLLRADQQAQINLLDQPVLQWDDEEEETHDKQRAGMPFQHVAYYRLLRRLGRPSGMGEVYLAKDERPQMGGRKVALKLMLAQLADRELARFKEEIAILIRLSHPNNIRLFECDEFEGRPYFVMEYFAGESLEDLIARGPLKLAEVVKITEQVCEALHEAHQKGIVHRDIKPSNIMLQQDGDKLIVKLIDYGIGALEGEATKTILPGSSQPGIVGTPQYLSPEQAAGVNRRAQTAAVDVYSFGLVVYEMLVGRRAFDCNTVNDYLNHQRHVTPPPPDARNDSIPANVSAVVMKALHKAPTARYPSARAFADALRQAAEGQPVEPIPPKPVPPKPVPLPAPITLGPSSQTIINREDNHTVPPWRKYLLPLAAVVALAAGGWGVASYLNKSPAQPPLNPPNLAGTGPETAKPLGSVKPVETKPAPPPVVSPIVKLKQSGVTGEVPFDKVFRKGERVRLLVTPAKAGYVYLVEHGTDGTVNLLYPMQREMPGSERTVPAQQAIEIPPANTRAPYQPWFAFDGKAGDEELYLVFAEEPGLLQLLALEQSVKSGNPRLPKQMLTTLQQQAATAAQPGFAVQRLVLKQK